MTNQSSQKPHDRLAAVLKDDLAAVSALIHERMASEHAPRIPEVTAHLVEAGGKRLRPMLTLAAARLCGYDGPYHIHLATTVEFIHTATLLHDDVVDESKQRRGRPTANLLWDNQSSVLVGDYLFARSFQLMTEPGSMRVMQIYPMRRRRLPRVKCSNLLLRKVWQQLKQFISKLYAAKPLLYFPQQPRWAV